jgi:hypothetical protein
MATRKLVLLNIAVASWPVADLSRPDISQIQSRDAVFYTTLLYQFLTETRVFLRDSTDQFYDMHLLQVQNW